MEKIEKLILDKLTKAWKFASVMFWTLDSLVLCVDLYPVQGVGRCISEDSFAGEQYKPQHYRAKAIVWRQGLRSGLGISPSWWSPLLWAPSAVRFSLHKGGLADCTSSPKLSPVSHTNSKGELLSSKTLKNFLFHSYLPRMSHTPFNKSSRSADTRLGEAGDIGPFPSYTD